MEANSSSLRSSAFRFGVRSSSCICLGSTAATILRYSCGRSFLTFSITSMPLESKSSDRACVLAVAVLLFSGAGLPPRSVLFSQSTKDLRAYDFVEITAQVAAPHASNPFTDAVIRGTFERVADRKRWQVEGFCDAEDGSVWRIRFMPPTPGNYVYSVEYRLTRYNAPSWLVSTNMESKAAAITAQTG